MSSGLHSLPTLQENPVHAFLLMAAGNPQDSLAYSSFCLHIAASCDICVFFFFFLLEEHFSLDLGPAQVIQDDHISRFELYYICKNPFLEQVNISQMLGIWAYLSRFCLSTYYIHGKIKMGYVPQSVTSAFLSFVLSCFQFWLPSYCLFYLG